MAIDGLEMDIEGVWALFGGFWSLGEKFEIFEPFCLYFGGFWQWAHFQVWTLAFWAIPPRLKMLSLVFLEIPMFFILSLSYLPKYLHLHWSGGSGSRFSKTPLLQNVQRVISCSFFIFFFLNSKGDGCSWSFYKWLPKFSFLPKFWILPLVNISLE